jgi:hypothetical protein
MADPETRCGPQPENSDRMDSNAGPASTTGNAGKMQSTIGKSSFTGAFWACIWCGIAVAHPSNIAASH